MPREYIRKTDRQISAQDMKKATEAVIDDGMSLRKAAEMHNVKKSTIADYVQKARSGLAFKLGEFNTRQIFSNDEEKELSHYLLNCSAMYHGLTPKSFKRLAYEYAVANGKRLPDSWYETKSAGKDWLTAFLKRNSELSLRSPEATSLSRMTSFNKTNVTMFQDKLEEVMKRHHFQPNQIFNLDETGCTTVQKVPKVISRKGLRQVGQLTSRERGELVTVVGIVSADGNAVPPVFVFPRVRFDFNRMMCGASPGSLGLANSSGWMTSDNFVRVLEYFVNYVHCSKDNKALLIMDNHESHLSVAGLNFAKENGVVILTLPPHTSNKLQPLDRTVFGPFKKFYNSACDSWMVNHPGQTITIYEIASLASASWDKAASTPNIKSGFRCTGIYPFDRTVFTEQDFLISFVTDRPNPNEQNNDNQIASTSKTPENQSASSNKSPEHIIPYPKAPERKDLSNRGGRKRGKSIIATDTPEKERIESEKNMKKCKSKKKKLFDVNIEAESSDEAAELSLDDDSDDSVEENMTNVLDEPVSREPDEDEYILVEFGGKVHYVAKVTKKNQIGEDFEVSYLRKSSKVLGSFIFPEIEDKALLSNDQVRAILPPPFINKNKRLNNYLKFSVSFEGINMR